MDTKDLERLLDESAKLHYIVESVRTSARYEGIYGYYVTCTADTDFGTHYGEHFLVLPYTAWDCSLRLIKVESWTDPGYMKNRKYDTIEVPRQVFKEHFVYGWQSEKRLDKLMHTVRVVRGIGVWSARTIADSHLVCMELNLVDLLEAVQDQDFYYLAYMDMFVEKKKKISKILYD